MLRGRVFYFLPWSYKYPFALLVVVRRILFLLPHGEAATVRKSGAHTESGQNPAVEHEPDGKKTDKPKNFHCDLLYMLINI